MRAFDKLPNKYWAGIDNIPWNFIKYCKASLALPISIIINKSIVSGIFPSHWKMVKVVPVHKSGSKNSINNYRPISILSAFSKNSEICIYNRVYIGYSSQWLVTSSTGFCLVAQLYLILSLSITFCTDRYQLICKLTRYTLFLVKLLTNST